MGQNLLFFLKRKSGFRGILDSFSNSAAAYSLQPLSKNTLNSPLVRVRRSSDNGELDFTGKQIIDGNLLGWVTEESATANGFVRTWYDQSGLARHAQQATALNQPLIVENGNLLVDSSGKPYIKFNNHSLLWEGSFSNPNPITFIHVSSFDLASLTYSVVSCGTSRLSYYRFTNDHALIFGPVIRGGVTNPNVKYLRFDVANAENSVIRANGQIVASGATSPGNADNRILLGGNPQSGFTNFQGRIWEAIIYTSDQTGNVSNIEGDLMERYNL